ncbi:MAG: YqaA family protein [Hyphomicrobiaceae bacterium]
MLLTLDQAWQLALLAVTAFASATILPGSSEIAMVAALKAGSAPLAWVLTAATFGNVGGSCLNFWLGLHARRFQDRRWFPFTPDSLDRATTRFQRYGLITLLFSWLPVIGDPLTFIAGVLRVPVLAFVTLVAIGKLMRYVLLAGAVTGL